MCHSLKWEFAVAVAVSYCCICLQIFRVLSMREVEVEVCDALKAAQSHAIGSLIRLATDYTQALVV